MLVAAASAVSPTAARSGSRIGAADAVTGPTLSASRTSLLVDGGPAFLLGVSVFGALDVAAPVDSDLDALKRWGVRLVRVWAHWHVPIYQADGELSPTGGARLRQLVEHVGARGMILELVLLRPGQLRGQPYAIFASEAARIRAVESITRAVQPYRHVLFDLYNEHDHPDGPISHAALRVLRDRVKAIDSSRLVTVSSTEGHLIDGSRANTTNLGQEAGTDATAVAVDVISPHFPRSDDWAAATGSRVAAIRSALDALGRPLPVYLNEERRADDRRPVRADAYRQAYTAARQAGAAGWVFHTDAGFELERRSFADSLRPQEREALSQLERQR